MLDTDGSGRMGYLEIPSIEVYLPIYHGTSEGVLQSGIGHLGNTSLPIGGENTHAVLSGHTGLPNARLLTVLDKLQEGDQFYIHVLDEILAYEVDQIKVVEPDDISDIFIEEGEDYVTLVTCTPYGINSHRLLVRGTRVPYTEEKKEHQVRPVQAHIIQRPVWGELFPQLPGQLHQNIRTKAAVCICRWHILSPPFRTRISIAESHPRRHPSGSDLCKIFEIFFITPIP